MFAQPDLFNHVSLLSDHAWSIYFLYGQGLCSLNAGICACLTGDWMCRQVNCLIIALQFSLQQLLHIILSLFLSELKCFVKKCDTSFCGFDSKSEPCWGFSCPQTILSESHKISWQQKNIPVYILQQVISE